MDLDWQNLYPSFLEVDGAHTLHSVPSFKRSFGGHELLRVCVHQVMWVCHPLKVVQDTYGASALLIVPNSRILIQSDSSISETEANADSGSGLICSFF
jgi:hypothetical protein